MVAALVTVLIARIVRMDRINWVADIENANNIIPRAIRQCKRQIDWIIRIRTISIEHLIGHFSNNIAYLAGVSFGFDGVNYTIKIIFNRVIDINLVIDMI